MLVFNSFVFLTEAAHKIFDDINGGDIMESAFKQYKDACRQNIKRKSNSASTKVSELEDDISSE